MTPNTGIGHFTYVDMGAYEFPNMGDCNANGLVDTTDFIDFVACLSGPEVLIGDACTCFDLDRDHDMDLVDFAAFQKAFSPAF